MSVLAVDAGTTGVTALVVGDDARVLSRGYEEFPQHFPQPGWVEHTPEEFWQAALVACTTALAAAESTPTCLGITNQRETAVVGSGDAASAATRHRLAGPSYGGAVPATSRSGARGPGERAHGAAARPVLHRHETHLAQREDPDTWAGVREGRVPWPARWTPT